MEKEELKPGITVFEASTQDGSICIEEHLIVGEVQDRFIMVDAKDYSNIDSDGYCYCFPASIEQLELTARKAVRALMDRELDVLDQAQKTVNAAKRWCEEHDKTGEIPKAIDN